MSEVISITRRFCFCLLVFLIAVGKGYALEAVASYTVFYTHEKNSYKPYLEIYWQIAPASLRFTEASPGQFTAKIKTELVLSVDTGIISIDRFVLQTNAATSVQQAQGQSIIDLHRYKIPAGNIKWTLLLEDAADANNKLVLRDSFKAERMGRQPKYSLQILDTSFASADRNIFSKNNRQQMPLCANFLDEWRNSLHYYMELYQSDEVPKDAQPLIQTTFISRKALTAPIYNIKRTDTIQQGSITPILGTFDIAKLPSGNYYLNVILENKDRESIASGSIFFQRFNQVKDTTVKPTADADTSLEKVNFLDLSTTFVGKYTLPQLKAILKMIRPISNAIEQDAIDRFADRPDDTYMRYFIYNFWKGRNNKDPKKAWLDYAELVKQVNKMFKGDVGQGYETDRGQLYLKYGKPNEVVTVENEQGVLPYEIWVYNVLPAQSLGGLFLFYRPADYVTGFKLLHSNVKGEVRNPSWRSFLYISGSNSSNLNSRAEQYFPGNK